MPGSKRKLDEDTWIVSQSKKFKQGILLSTVYETTLAHLRLGARNFFTSLIAGPSPANNVESSPASPVPSPNGSSSERVSHLNTPPGSPLVRDILSDNELQSSIPTLPRPSVICPECALRGRSLVGNQERYGKCTYCDKLVCHLNACRRCGSEFCGDCSIAKYDDSSTDAYECYNCLH